MLHPRPLSSQEHIAETVSHDPLVETGVESFHDGALRLYGEKGTQALDDLNAQFTVDAIKARQKAAAEAQIDRKPGASIKLSDRSEAMSRFVKAVSTINQAKGAGAALSTPGSDFRTRYADPTKVADSMENKAILAERDADIARRVLTGEAALLSAGFDDLYAMAARRAVRNELAPLWETGPKAQKKRMDAVSATSYPKQNLN